MKKFAAFAAILTVLLSLLSVAVSAETETITAVVFANDTAVAEENLSLSGYGDKDSGYAASTDGGRIFASVSGTDLRKLEWSKGEYGEHGMQAVMTGGTKNPWGNGAYLELRVSAAGYEHLTFSADIGATNKGPRDFQLQYSTDGKTFTDIAGADFTVTTNKTMFSAFENVALPADADNCDTLVVRIAVASNILVNGTAGLIGSVGGEVAINNVTLCGDKIAEETTTAAVASTTTTVTTTIPATEDTTAASTAVTTKSTDAVKTALTTVTVKKTTTADSENAAAVDTGETTRVWFALVVMAIGAVLIPLSRTIPVK